MAPLNLNNEAENAPVEIAILEPNFEERDYLSRDSHMDDIVRAVENEMNEQEAQEMNEQEAQAMNEEEAPEMNEQEAQEIIEEEAPEMNEEEAPENILLEIEVKLFIKLICI